MVTYSPNPEYLGLPFARPRAWGTGRGGRGWPAPLPRLLVVHHTAGAEHAQAAEGGAGYDQTRTDGTSAHYYIDPDSTVQCVETWNRSNTAFYNGNTLGIHYELCGTLQTRAQWLDANSYPIIRRAAVQMRRDAAKYGIPLVRLTAAQVAAGQRGICGHVDITHAFPADGGTHTDPGPNFPWDVLLAELTNPTTSSGADMTPDESQNLANVHTWLLNYFNGKTTGTWPHSTGALPVLEPNKRLAAVDASVTELRALVTAQGAKLDAIMTALESGTGIPAGGGDGGAGVTAEQVRTIVDEELDEQSRGGADTDTA